MLPHNEGGLSENTRAALLLFIINNQEMSIKSKIIACTAMLSSVLTASANDGVYFTSGNFLVPTQETDISVDKEILTITIGKDNYARVDVYYELMNHGTAKTVTMAFEAAAPYNAGATLNTKGVHPYIDDFTVNMNGNTLGHRNAVVAARYQDGLPDLNFTPLDLSKWRDPASAPDTVDIPADDMLYNAATDSLVSYAYAYFFEAPFQPGRNIVHHTYRYRMSYNVGQRFTIPYWLTPAMRWANHQINDFTLRITADEPTGFCIADSLFASDPFHAEGRSRIYSLTDSYGTPSLFAEVANGDTVSWHSAHFRPTTDMCVAAPTWERTNVTSREITEDKVVVDRRGRTYRYLANCGDSYFVEAQDYGLVKQADARLETLRAAKGQGYLTVNSDEAKRVNVRMRPTTSSKVVAQLTVTPGDLSESYACLGLVQGKGKDRSWQWYKVKVGSRTGYVRQDLMLWDAINL